MGKAITLLNAIKKEFEIINSVCGTEEYSDGTKITNETLAFTIPINSEIDENELCAIVEIIYILKTFKSRTLFINLYYRVFERNDGEQAVYLTNNFIKSLLSDFKNSEVFIAQILEKIRDEKENFEFCGYKEARVILQNRLNWIKRGSIYRRRLAIGIIDKKVKQMKLVIK